MKPIAFIYTCRNPGQVSLLWTHQPPPFGHGWIDVKAEPLVSLRDVEAQYVSLLPGVYYMDPPDGGQVELYEQMQRMAQDAARYRRLRDGGYLENMLGPWHPCDEPDRLNLTDRMVDRITK